MDTSALPKTRKAAKIAGATHYFTGVPCSNGHLALRKVSGKCVECVRHEWQNPTPRRKESRRKYDNQEARAAARRAHYEKNKDRYIQQAKQQPPEKRKEWNKNWAKRNKLYIRSKANERRKRNRQAQPAWLRWSHRKEMQQLYRIAKACNEEAGRVMYAVDHIYPINSPEVCGLHVPWNLRIITREENLKKTNKMPPPGNEIAFPP
jgi:hypothetical protein